jgi:hypothetical protein
MAWAMAGGSDGSIQIENGTGVALGEGSGVGVGVEVLVGVRSKLMVCVTPASVRTGVGLESTGEELQAVATSKQARLKKNLNPSLPGEARLCFSP